MVSKEEIDALIEATDMVALVSPYVKLEKSGSGYKGLCPFHSEKTPSFHVSQEKKIAKCFGCGEGGSPITFLMKIKNIGFEEAVLELAKINNFKLKSYKVDPLYAQNKKYFEMNEIALELFDRNLFKTISGEKALKYLHDRGLDDETIKYFNIGLAPKDNVLYDLLKANNCLELDMVNCGLVSNINNHYSDVFKDRIMFTIKDENNKILGFSGRLYENIKDSPKYINTSETNIFKKNLVLYNIANAIKYIKENNRVVLFEGFMDVIAASRSNIKESVCSMGTAFTKGQMRLLKKYTNNIIVAFDNDNAGLMATKKAISLLEAEGFNVSVFRIKNAKDCDEFVLKFGKDKFNEFFNNNIISGLDFYYTSVLENVNLNDLRNVENAKNEIFSYLRKQKSNLIVSRYIDKLSNDLKVDKNILLSDYNKISNNYVDNQYDDQSVSINVVKPTKEKRREYAEYRLFYYAFNSKKYALYIDEKLRKNNAYKAFNTNYRSLWLYLIDNYYAKFDHINHEELVADLTKEKLIDYYIEIVKENENFNEKLRTKDSRDDLDDTIDKFISNSNECYLNEITKQIKVTNSNEMKENLLIKLFENCKKNNRR